MDTAEVVQSISTYEPIERPPKEAPTNQKNGQAEETSTTVVRKDLLRRKDYKTRLQEIELLITKLNDISVADSDEWRTYVTALMEGICDPHVFIQESSLRGVLILLEKCSYVRSFTDDIVPLILNKCSVTTKNKTKEVAADVVVKFMKHGDLHSLKLLLDGIDSKNRRISTVSIFILNQALKDLGPESINICEALVKVARLPGSARNQKEAVKFLLECHKHLGDFRHPQITSRLSDKEIKNLIRLVESGKGVDLFSSKIKALKKRPKCIKSKDTTGTGSGPNAIKDNHHETTQAIESQGNNSKGLAERVLTFEKLKTKLGRLAGDCSKEWDSYSGLLIQGMNDDNVTLNEKALEATLLFAKNTYVPKSFIICTIPILVSKFIIASEDRIKELATEVILMFIEVKQHFIATKSLMDCTESEDPRIVASSINILTKSLNAFGAEVISINNTVLKIANFLNSEDRKVINEATEYIIECYRWVGRFIFTEIPTVLSKSQLQELKMLLDNIQKPGERKAARFLRSEIKNTGYGKTALKRETVNRVGNFEKGVDISSMLDAEFFDRLRSKKYVEFKAGFESLKDILENNSDVKCNAKCLEELIRILHQTVYDSSQAPILLLAIQGMGLVAQAFRRNSILINNSFSWVRALFKNLGFRGNNVLRVALRKSLDELYPITTLDRIYCLIKPQLLSIDRQRRFEALDFIRRNLSTSNRDSLITQKKCPSLMKHVMKLIDDQDDIIRNLALTTLAGVVLITGWDALKQCCPEMKARDEEKITVHISKIVWMESIVDKPSTESQLSENGILQNNELTTDNEKSEISSFYGNPMYLSGSPEVLKIENSENKKLDRYYKRESKTTECGSPSSNQGVEDKHKIQYHNQIYSKCNNENVSKNISASFETIDFSGNKEIEGPCKRESKTTQWELPSTYQEIDKMQAHEQCYSTFSNEEVYKTFSGSPEAVSTESLGTKPLERSCEIKSKTTQWWEFLSTNQEIQKKYKIHDLNQSYSKFNKEEDFKKFSKKVFGNSFQVMQEKKTIDNNIKCLIPSQILENILQNDQETQIRAFKKLKKALKIIRMAAEYTDSKKSLLHGISLLDFIEKGEKLSLKLQILNEAVKLNPVTSEIMERIIGKISVYLKKRDLEELLSDILTTIADKTSLTDVTNHMINKDHLSQETTPETSYLLKKKITWVSQYIKASGIEGDSSLFYEIGRKASDHKDSYIQEAGLTLLGTLFKQNITENTENTVESNLVKNINVNSFKKKSSGRKLHDKKRAFSRFQSLESVTNISCLRHLFISFKEIFSSNKPDVIKSSSSKNLANGVLLQNCKLEGQQNRGLLNKKASNLQANKKKLNPK